MAERVFVKSDAPETVDEILKCLICDQKLTEPTTLPCSHNLCLDCLANLPCLDQGDCYMVKCPFCSTEPTQPAQDAISGSLNLLQVTDNMDWQQLPMAVAKKQPVTCGCCNKGHVQGFCRQCHCFVCQKCIDVHRQMEGLFTNHEITITIGITAATSQLSPVQNSLALECPKHQNQLSIFCRAFCDQMISSDCTVLEQHDHSCDPVSNENIFLKIRQEITDNLLRAKLQLAVIFDQIVTHDKEMEAIAENRERVKDEIQGIGEQMIAETAAAIQQSVVQLKREADTVAKQKLRFMSARKEDVLLVITMLQSYVEHVEREMRTDSQLHLLTSGREIVDRIKAVTIINYYLHYE